jgi:hypothetical protein
MALPSIGPGRLVISSTQAHSVLGLFFRVGIAANELTDKDCCFAQALMMEAVDASFKMGFVEAILSGVTKVPSGPTAVIKAILKSALKNTLKYADRDKIDKMLAKPVLYKSVVATLSRNFKTVWAIREQTGELDY